MSETDVIRAFLDGGELSEAALRTDGKQLFSGGGLIAEKRGGKLHVMENDVGRLDPEHRRLLLDFVAWREQRAKVLRRLLAQRKCWRWRVQTEHRRQRAFAAGAAKRRSMKAIVDPDICTGCGECADICPEVFEMVERSPG